MSMKEAVQRFKMPHTLAVVWILVVLVLVASWVIPSGSFQRVETVVDGARRMVTVPGTFQVMEKTRLGLEQVLLAPFHGFVKKADLIIFLLIIGGAFQVLMDTGAVEAGIRRLARKLAGSPSLERLFIPVMMSLFSLAGSTFGMSEEVIPFVLIFVPLARRLGYDAIVGLSIPFLGAAAGFAAAFVNPFTVGIAQRLSDLPPGSGTGYRYLVWVLGTGLTIAYVSWYAARVKRNPELSAIRDLEREAPREEDDGEVQPWQGRYTFALLALMATMGLLVWGVQARGWYFEQLGALFLGMGLVLGLGTGMGADRTARSFLAGAKDMVGVALVVSCATALLVIAQEAKIMDTMLHAASWCVAHLPRVVTAQVMFLVQCVLNFFIHSGTSQAALTMPIMAPLADLVGISRQTAVLAFQLCEFIVPILPTSAVTMAVLSAARIPWERWARWFLPLMGLMVVLSLLLLVPPVLFFHY